MQTESGAGAPGTVAAPLRHAAGERLLPLRAELVGHRHLARRPGLNFLKSNSGSSKLTKGGLVLGCIETKFCK